MPLKSIYLSMQNQRIARRFSGLQNASSLCGWMTFGLPFLRLPNYSQSASSRAIWLPSDRVLTGCLSPSPQGNRRHERAISAPFLRGFQKLAGLVCCVRTGRASGVWWGRRVLWGLVHERRDKRRTLRLGRNGDFLPFSRSFRNVSAFWAMFDLNLMH